LTVPANLPQRSGIVTTDYELVRLRNGTFSVRSSVDRETFHPVAGPIAEAEALYVRQLRLRERAVGEFVIWDIGLGAGGNALTAIRHLSDTSARIHIISFDRTTEALRFASAHAVALEFPIGFESEIATALRMNSVEFARGPLQVRWELKLGDFPAQMGIAAEQRDVPSPDVIFFDAFSPKRNPEMWTLTLFENLFRILEPGKPCSLATFSRSTAVRVAMLLGGFFVGVGDPVSEKEETTTAANSLELISNPLDFKWLQRAKISRNAEPLRGPVYRQHPLSPRTWEQLRAHPQFA
jgi:tRNA U34 5-methylaminomethyl-2-thiouridine-forming methyltransferase MnmC